ncbi:MAG: DUF4433 domain-containing protein [Lachnospiraceae bacterium]|nr:DUF4433 domain-containing protein [Lachnospiraceae bacterium]
MRPSELFKELTGNTALYNIQAIDNIPSIMKNGILSHEKAERIEHISIAMADVQEKRSLICIPDGMMLHRYANLYFSSWNPMLSAKRGENDNICILMISSAVLDINGVIISDRNASSQYASFYSPLEGLRAISFDMVYARSWMDDDYYEYLKKKSIKCAEVLVPYKIPCEFIICAAVASDNAARKMEAAGFDRQIYVKPLAFF